MRVVAILLSVSECISSIKGLAAPLGCESVSARWRRSSTSGGEGGGEAADSSPACTLPSFLTSA